MDETEKNAWIRYLEHNEKELTANGRLALVISLSAVAVFWGMAKSDNPFRYHALLASSIALVISIALLSSAFVVRRHYKKTLFPSQGKRHDVLTIEKAEERMRKEIKCKAILSATISAIILAILHIITRFLL